MDTVEGPGLGSWEGAEVASSTRSWEADAAGRRKMRLRMYSFAVVLDDVGLAVVPRSDDDGRSVPLLVKRVLDVNRVPDVELR